MNQANQDKEPNSISPFRHSAGHYIRMALKLLLALAAAANLIALFVYHYELPARFRPKSSDTPQPSATVATPQPIEEKFMIPVIPLNYSGEEELDKMIMNDVYLLGRDRQPLEDADIRYELLPGESRLKRIIRYSVTLESGQTLTADRAMQLTTRYTGPNITLLGMLPAVDPSDASGYLEQLIQKTIIRADDGFGNDVTDQVTIEFESISEENSGVNMILRVENQIHDTFEKTLLVDATGFNGVVLTLTANQITLQTGSAFEPMDYISEAHDAAGNDLMDHVAFESDVNTGNPGEYEVLYWTEDADGHLSPAKTLQVTVEGEPVQVSPPRETWWTQDNGHTFWAKIDDVIWRSDDNGMTWEKWGT